jgi:hypothetical protein
MMPWPSRRTSRGLSRFPLTKQIIAPAVLRHSVPCRLRWRARQAGLQVAALRLFETPLVYLAFHPLAFALGVAYERLVNRFEALAPLRVNLLAVLGKP